MVNPSVHARRGLFIAVTGLALSAMVGCADMAVSPGMPQPPSTAPAIAPDALVGAWGLASFHQDKDRPRTEKEARAQCSNPYLISKGPNGGVMIHLADEKEPRELIVKTAPGGQSFIGPEGPPGDVYDREIVSFDTSMIVTNWVDPEVAGRYGTMVFVRCSGAANSASQKPKPTSKPVPGKTA